MTNIQLLHHLKRSILMDGLMISYRRLLDVINCFTCMVCDMRKYLDEGFMILERNEQVNLRQLKKLFMYVLQK